MTTVFVNDLSLKALMKTKNLSTIKYIVCFDAFTEQQANYFKEKNITLKLYSEIVKAGKENKKNYK